MGLGSVNGCDHSGVGSCNRYRQGVLRVCNPTTRVSVPPDPSPFADNKLASRDHPVRGVVFVKSLSPGESPGCAFARICDGLPVPSSRALGPVVDAVLRGHGGVLASVPVRWVAVHVELSALDLNDEGLS